MKIIKTMHGWFVTQGERVVSGPYRNAREAQDAQPDAIVVA